LINNFSLSNSFKITALTFKSDFALDNKQINFLGLKNGLSDYWGSSVSEFGTSKLNVSPILPNGKPNFWAHSPYNYRSSNSDDILNYNFVYTRDIDFTNSIIKAYGEPDKIYQLGKEIVNPKIVELDSINKDYRYILFYNKNSIGWSNIQANISDKATKEYCQ
tara:strand:- start:517 stop:1005 length:489 start_codon:yes stop_codon:yes gene_type:complete